MSHEILVIGSEGFIGSNLCQNRNLDRYDLMRGEDACECIPRGYETVVLLACDMRDSQYAYDRNMRMYKRLSELHLTTRIIYTSSAAVYGESDSPRVETHRREGKGWYAMGKILGEEAVDAYPHAILRLSNVYGPGGHGVINRFRNGHNQIYDDGEAIRDYIPVKLVVDCINAAIKHPEKWSGITNVSSGIATSVNDLWELYGIGEPVYVAGGSGLRYSVLDNRKMLRQL